MPGGVCQVLDYEVDLMADYVSEMATRIVTPQAAVTTAFRKFVAQILTSTRLPSTTILLGMNYLAKRINMMAAAGHTNHSEGQVWRMLTIALLLGSKFLDDNTFQNKSWSEVSGIPVRELNTLEYEWLSSINWCLYVNMDESKDYNAWLDNWRTWLKAKQQQQARATHERLASLVSPIDTEGAVPRNRHAYSSWHQQQVAEYERLANMKRNQGQLPSFQREQPSWAYPVSWHGPVTPPDSGYGTPEYCGSATSANAQYNEWFDRAISHQSNEPHQYQPSVGFGTYTQQPHNHANYPAYYNYNHNIWEPPSVADCSCPNCIGSAYHKPQPYFIAHGYDQPVMG
ncbi:hypothetical protein VTK73DRAFT_4248 [Phialemonium thermophilum]|uniref:Uncharacterized protein n=1 Tax=Phialemonium thermophilum TaxID=223376 RepID=A0ABR3WV57_9PEZI